MKKDISINGNFSLLNKWLRRFSFILGLILVVMLQAKAQETQTDTTVTPSTATEEPAKEAEETTIKSKMSLSADQYPDGTIILNGLLRAKIKGSYQKVPDRKIEFFALNAAGEESAIGDTLTDSGGMAKIRANKSALARSEDGSYSFISRFGGDKSFEGSESDLSLLPAMLIMEPRTEDSTNLIDLKATADAPGGPKPIAAAKVSVFVKRMFSLLKVGEGETDEEGKVEIEFPKGLSGDDNGNVEITATIEETDQYGNLAASTTQKWGNPVSSAFVESPRALWSPHPPTWMVITFFILMGAVWIHYAIVIYNMVMIKRGRIRMTGKS
ncbi:MAG: hypothetical protein WBP41_18745 [Saprospiraceae bacterium]